MKFNFKKWVLPTVITLVYVGVSAFWVLGKENYYPVSGFFWTSLVYLLAMAVAGEYKNSVNKL